MTNHSSAKIDCRLIAEYVDEGEIPAGVAAQGGEVVRPRIVATYLDHWSQEDHLKKFTVVLQQGGIATVQGHGLKVVQPTHAGGTAHYAILQKGPAEKVIVGLFPATAVQAIFSGEMEQFPKQPQIHE